MPVRDYRTDELGVEGFSRMIARAATGTAEPFTIGVYGDWENVPLAASKFAKSKFPIAYGRVSDSTRKFGRNEPLVAP